MKISADDATLLLIDVQNRIFAAMEGRDDLGAQLDILLRGAAELSLPMIVSEQYPQGLGPTIAPLQPLISGARVLPKTQFSCLANPDLRDVILSSPRRQLVVAGIEGHVCVLQTVLDARAAGLEVFVVANAVASRKSRDLALGLDRMARAGAHLVTVEMVLFECLGQAGGETFRAISRLVR